MNYEEQMAEFFALNPDIDFDGYHVVFYHDSDCPVLHGSHDCECTPQLHAFSAAEYEAANVKDIILTTEAYQP